MCESYVPGVSDQNGQSRVQLYQPPGTKMCLHKRREWQYISSLKCGCKANYSGKWQIKAKGIIRDESWTKLFFTIITQKLSIPGYLARKCSTLKSIVYLRLFVTHEIMWNANLMQQGNFIYVCVYGADGARHHPHRTHDLHSRSQDHSSKNSVQKTISCNSTSNAPDDGRMYPKYVELRIHQ